MKKTCVVALGLLFISTAAFAKEIDAGRISMTGASSFTYNSLNLDAGGATSDVTITTITVNGVYYLVPNLGVGANVAYEKASLEETDLSLTAIGPAVTYNFSINDALSLFANGNIGYAKAKVAEEDLTGWFLSAGGGLKYFVRDDVSIDGTLNYSYSKIKDGSDIKISGLSFGAGFSVYLK